MSKKSTGSEDEMVFSQVQNGQIAKGVNHCQMSTSQADASWKFLQMH